MPNDVLTLWRSYQLYMFYMKKKWCTSNLEFHIDSEVYYSSNNSFPDSLKNL